MTAILLLGATQSPPSSYMLRELKDVAQPDPVSWWPQTLGWQILLLMLLLYLGYRLYLKGIFWWRNRYRQEAITALQSLSAEDPHWPTQMMKIIKIVMVYLEPKNASLYGAPLLEQMGRYHTKAQLANDESFQQWLKCLEDPNAARPDFSVVRQGLSLWLSGHHLPEAGHGSA
ncbi:hypothetical protein Shewana3_3557 [Shewanella sp. ANA-3]|uniref:DUF4381 domain-containing protein n=1 Tax=Shewanella sp. (strain ANA-3) TaxID=94122 RepID=UPI00005DF87E|nr:DUF4381 domain-containing protein [Shewanella sp. ANA-3]ABK49780.1 hypothetical protein Shewana3_3557 [Shewanella sp. ANA-3]